VRVGDDGDFHGDRSTLGDVIGPAAVEGTVVVEVIRLAA
jgi:hypothetical protein